MAGEYTPDGTYVKEISTGCSAIGLAENGQALYLRGLESPLKKIGLDGRLLWESSVVAGRIPVSPMEVDQTVYICTNSGRLSALDAATGQGKWEYQVSPQLYVMSGVGVNKGVVFTSGLDGFVTAIHKATTR